VDLQLLVVSPTLFSLLLVCAVGSCTGQGSVEEKRKARKDCDEYKCEDKNVKMVNRRKREWDMYPVIFKVQGFVPTVQSFQIWNKPEFT